MSTVIDAPKEKTAKKSDKPKPPPTETRSFTLPLKRWHVDPKKTPREWVTLTLPFSEAMKFLRVTPYDFENNKGEQRERIEAWAKKLAKEMEGDTFTPTPWSGGFRKNHRKTLVISDDAATVTFAVDTKDPLAHIDGGHRCAALQIIRKKRETEGDKHGVGLIDNLPIDITIYLDPNRLQGDFQALQQGRKVSTGLTRLMKIRGNNLPAEKRPIASMALDVAVALNQDKDSHLFGQVVYGTSATNKVGIDTLTDGNASVMSCSIFGGAAIAVANQKDAGWLQETYKEAYLAVETMCEKAEDAKHPMVLDRENILCPLGAHDGKKGGTILLNGVANMLAWLKITYGHERATTEDLEKLAQAVDLELNQDRAGGLDAPRKRELMGAFARELFRDTVLSYGESPRIGKFAHRDGVPLPLLDIIPPSSFGLKKDNLDHLPDPSATDADDDEPMVDGFGLAIDTDGEVEEVIEDHSKGKKKK